MLNFYPDSLGGSLKEAVNVLSGEEFRDVFSSVYILPSLFHSDLDRGFSIIDYDLNEELAKPADIEALKALGLKLKLDLILNHASVNSPQFKDLLEKGQDSEYRDFFINWNEFWEGFGETGPEGYIIPDDKYIKDMFFRKPGLPLLMVEFPDGSKVPFWNTFYQKTWTEGGKVHYLGQMDLNIKSRKVLDFYKETLEKLAAYGASIIRLDAFAYAAKAPGSRNFLNNPATWELLSYISETAEPLGLKLLPEIHASYEEKIYKQISAKGYLTYDFFLPSLIIDALETGDGSFLKAWADELTSENIDTVNMLGCHDGIPVLDLKGLLPEERIDSLIEIITARGGIVKNLHGQKNVYYQVNASYYSALGEDDKKLLLARALQLFMPGRPQIWYLDLFAGKNDLQAVAAAGEGGHKEINRTNLSIEEIEERLKMPVVKEQLNLIRFRNTFPAFKEGSRKACKWEANIFTALWEKDGYEAVLEADLEAHIFSIFKKQPGDTELKPVYES